MSMKHVQMAQATFSPLIERLNKDLTERDKEIERLKNELAEVRLINLWHAWKVHCQNECHSCCGFGKYFEKCITYFEKDDDEIATFSNLVKRLTDLGEL